jgi:ribosomal-protein-alanine N-acetyltransferase
MTSPKIILNGAHGISLRPFSLADVSAVSQLANDEAIWRNMPNSFPYPYTEKDAQDWITFITSPSSTEPNWAICLHEQAIGSISIDDIGTMNQGVGQIGYWLGRDYWGKGYTPIATQAVTDWALDKGGYHRLEANVYSWNPSSARVLEKCGYQLEATLKQRIIKMDTRLDELIYTKIK